MSKKNFTYVLEIDAEINDLLTKTNQVKKSMESMMASGKAPGADKIFENLERAINKLQQKASQPIDSVGAFSSLKKDAYSVEIALEKLGNIIGQLHNMDLADKMELLPPDLQARIKNAQGALEQFNQTIEKNAKKTEELKEAESELKTAQKELAKAEGKASEKRKLLTIQEAAVKTAQDEAQAIKDKKAALEQFLKTQQAYEAAGGDKRKVGGGKAELAGMNLPADRKAAKSAMPGLDLNNVESVKGAIAQLSAEYKQATKTITDAESTQRNYQKALNDSNNVVQVAKEKVENLESSAEKLNNEFEQNKAKEAQTAYTNLRKELEKLGIDLSKIPIDYTEENFNQLKAAMNQLAVDGVKEVESGLNTLQNEFQETGSSASNLKDELENSGNVVEELDTKMKNTQAFANRIKQFIGLQGAAKIARAAFRNAFEEVKKLDAAMTEMAVVTDLDIGDYWKQLPEHTKRANELGLAIEEVYKAETLYYQQGLKTAEAQALANETLKMARIAGLEASEATDKMTAALRGFNMELNEASAQKVSDVYSELAAITAADVNEISSAMTKTASIASSAGMEFETTAAFLSQIIETTRESAETAGTAMKTVIARFSEVKKLQGEGLTSGQDSEGEIIDVNKIQTALRSVGISMDEFFAGTEGLDSIFLKLAEKWDTLDVKTQRYIATTAAGSRQQSRFIAMMSDYGRTQELVTAANNSAGASQEQYEKTLNSLQTALARLENAWNTFTMSLMNNEALKLGIDALTGILNAINKVIEFFDRMGLGSVASIGMVVGALALGAKAINAFELQLMGVDGQGKKTVTTLQALANTGKLGFEGLKKSIKDIPKKLQETRNKLVDLNKVSRQSKSQEFIDAKKNYTKAAKEANDATNHYNVLMARSFTTEQQWANAEKMRVATKGQLAQAEMALYAAMELTDGQIQQANGLTIQGVAADTAAIVAKSGWTTASIAQYAATNNLTQAEAAEEIAAKLNGKTTLQNTIAKGLNALSTKLQAKADKGGIGSKLASTAATWLQTAANWALNASMIVIIAVIFLVIAAIALLVLAIIAIVAAIKKAQENSPEGKLKAAKKATEEATKAADEAAESYKNLSDAFDSLSDKYDSLEELTEGTKEWREAMQEINAEVMDLVDKYPELAGLVKGENGVLKLDIESSEVQGVLAKYEQKSVLANSAKLAAQNYENKAQTNVDYQNLGFESTVYTYDKYSGNYVQDRESTDAFAKAMADGAVLQNENGEWEVADQQAVEALGLTAEQVKTFGEQLGDGTDKLKEYGQAMRQREQQERVYMQQMANNALSAVDESKYTEKQLQQMSNAAKGDLQANLVSSESSRIASMSKEAYKEEAGALAKELYGDTAKVNKDGSISYEDENGEEQKISKEAFSQQMAASSATAKMTAALEAVPARIAKLTKSLDKFSHGLGQSYNQIMTSSEQTTLADTQNIKANEAEIRSQLEGAYHMMSGDERRMYGSEDAFVKEFMDQVDEINKKFESAQTALSTYGTEVDKLNSKFTAGGAEKYKQVLDELAIGLGGNSEVISNVNDNINKIAGSLSKEGFDTFMRELNAIDKTDLNAWEGLSTTLTELGYGSLTTSTAFKELVVDCQSAAGAIRKIDFKAFSEQVQGVQNIIDSVKTGEFKRGEIDEESYNKIIASNANLQSDFIKNLDGSYTYLGSSMAELVNALNESTEVERQNQIAILNDRIASSEMMDMLKNQKFASSDTVMDINSADSWTGAQQREYIATMVESFKLSGKDISSLGLGITNDTNIEALNKASNADIEKIISGLMGYSDSTESVENKKRLENETAQFAMQAYSIEHNVGSMQSMNANQYDDTESYLNALQSRAKVIMQQALEEGVNDSDVAPLGDKIKELSNIDLSSPDALAQIEALGIDEITQELLQQVDLAKQLNEEYQGWTSQYDYLDQLNRQINQTTREKEQAERRYQRLLKDENATQEQLLAAMDSRMQALNNELDQNTKKWSEAMGSMSEMTDINGANAEFAQYVSFDSTTGAVEVDYSGAEAAFGDNVELGEKFDEYVGSLYDLQSVAEEAYDSIGEIEDEVEELTKTGEEDYNSLWNSVKEALIASNQESIDKLSDINDSIVSAQNAMVNEMQNSIQEQRQQRENEQTEKNIADKQAQLAYLAMDTSGANSLEMASLQQEIDTETQNYQDSLVDQALQNIQDANARAEEQRQIQIDLAQAQLDAYAVSQQAWIDAQAVLNAGLTAGDQNISFGMEQLGTELTSSIGLESSILNQSLADLLGGAGGVAELNSIEQANWQQELQNQMAAAEIYASIEGYTDATSVEAKNAVDRINSTKDSMEKKIDNLTSPTTMENEWKKYSENQLVKDYAADIDSLEKKAKDEKELKKATTYNDLLNDDVKIDEKSYKQLQSKGYISSDKSYESFSSEYDNAQRTSLGGQTMSQVSASVGGGENKEEGNAEEEENYMVRGIDTRKIHKIKGASLGSDFNHGDLMSDASEDGTIYIGGTGYALSTTGSNEGLAEAAAAVHRGEGPNNGEIFDGDVFEFEGSYYIYVRDGEKIDVSVIKEKKDYSAFKSAADLNQYKTGGLADFTGPAWLDGTPSHPEYVLNADQTERFFSLVDVLESFNKSDSSTSSSKGDNYFDIEINVEKIEDDYDVEQVAEKIKQIIYEDASYRNVNAINHIR